MSYIHGANQAQLQAITLRQQAAAAEALQAESQVAAIRSAERGLLRNQRRRDKAITELLKVRDAFNAEAEAAESDLASMREARLDIVTSARKAAAIAGKAERELTRAEEAELDLRRLHRERHRMAEKLRDKKAASAVIVRRMKSPAKLPDPIYGGREGLSAATREAAQWDREKRRVA